MDSIVIAQDVLRSLASQRRQGLGRSCHMTSAPNLLAGAADLGTQTPTVPPLFAEFDDPPTAIDL